MENKIIKISVDTLGSETTVENLMKGLYTSFLRNENYFCRIFGDKKKIKKELNKYSEFKNNIEIVDCTEIVEMNDKPSDVMRTKKNSSMYRSIVSVLETDSQAVLSCGNTGALMALSLLNIKSLESIKRPAIASIWPNTNGESIVLDLGANTKLNTQYLVDNAILGSSLASSLLKIKNPFIEY